MVDTEL